MVKVLEPHHNWPSCEHFSQSDVPALYKLAQAAVVQELSTGHSLLMKHY